MCPHLSGHVLLLIATCFIPFPIQICKYRFAGVSVGYPRHKIMFFFNSSLFNPTRNTQHVLPISTQNSELRTRN